MEFLGFPDAALDFYDDLEVDNTKSFWAAHKPTYDTAVRAPMVALCDLLAPEFGEAKVFRPHRDVRFAADKSPYKTHQGAFVATGPATGYYVELSARGLRVGGGFYEATGPRLAALRTAMADEIAGALLVSALDRVRADGFDVSGDRLKTAPRGWPSDHPRIDLLRHKQLIAVKAYGFDGLAEAELVDRVREDWRAVRPLVSWLSDH